MIDVPPYRLCTVPLAFGLQHGGEVRDELVARRNGLYRGCGAARTWRRDGHRRCRTAAAGGRECHERTEGHHAAEPRPDAHIPVRGRRGSYDSQPVTNDAHTHPDAPPVLHSSYDIST